VKRKPQYRETSNISAIRPFDQHYSSRLRSFLTWQ